MGFIRIGPLNVSAKFEVRSFTRSWDNKGYPKKFGLSLDTSTLAFLQNWNEQNELLFRLAL